LKQNVLPKQDFAQTRYCRKFFFLKQGLFKQDFAERKRQNRINFAEISPDQKCIWQNEILAKLRKGEALQTTCSALHICTATLAFFMDNAESSWHSIKIQN
jgi:hypothetical protein